MTVTAKRRAKLKAQRTARKVRERVRIDKRKAKRAAKSAPKRSLAAWGVTVRARGKCAVCGCGVVPKFDRDGLPKLSKHKRPILIPLNAHHLLPKEKYPELKLLAVNGICLCPQHHKYGRHSAHRNPIWFAWWLQYHLPKQYDWCIANMGTG